MNKSATVIAGTIFPVSADRSAVMEDLRIVVSGKALLKRLRAIASKNEAARFYYVAAQRKQPRLAEMTHLSGTVILNGLLQLFARIHHEWAIARHRLVDRFTAEHQQRTVRPRFEFDGVAFMA
jgi:hypothetical protein